MNDKSFQLGFFSSSRFDNSHENDLLYSTCKGAYISIGGFRANLDFREVYGMRITWSLGMFSMLPLTSFAGC